MLTHFSWLLISWTTNSAVSSRLLKDFCKFYNLSGVKTVDYGTLFELSYKIRMKDISQQKELIDKLREKNGNLNIALVQNYEDMQ